MAKNGDDQASKTRFRNFTPPNTEESMDDLTENDDFIDETDAPVTAEQRDLALLMSELGVNPTASVTIYRHTGTRSKGAYIMSFHPSSRSMTDVMDYLRDAKRGGQFRFYVNDGRVMVGNKTVEVDPPTPDEIRAYEEKQRSLNPVINTQTPPSQNNEIALLLQKMEADRQRADDERKEERRIREEDRKEEQRRREEEQKRRDDQLREDRIREEARADRQNELMMKLLTNKPEKSSLSEMLEGMVAMQALNGGNKKEADPLALIDRVLDIQRKLTDEAPGQQKSESVVNTAIKHLGAPLLTVLAQMNKPAMMSNPSPRQPIRQPKPVNDLPAPVAEISPTTPTTPATQSPEEKLAMLLQEIVQAAQSNADPAPYAAKLIEQLGEDQCAPLVQDDEEGDAAFGFLMTQLGQAGIDYRPWFDKLREVMLDSLFESADSELDDEQGTTVSDETGDSLSG